MPRPTTPVTIKPGHFPEDEVHTHPSYGVIQISRMSGQADLFNSPVKHQHFIALRVSTAKLHTDGLHDNIWGDDQLVEVYMSESQFARAITSIGMGAGAPCTISSTKDERMTPGAEPRDLAAQQKTMIRDKFEKVMDGQQEITKQMQEWHTAKHRPTLKEMDDIIHRMEVATGNFASNTQFYTDAYIERIEGIVDDAKTELETHALGVAGKLGISEDQCPTISMRKPEPGLLE